MGSDGGVMTSPTPPVSLRELLDALEFISSGGDFVEHGALVCRQTGKVYLHSEGIELDELPDDIEDDEKYIAIPSKRDLDLGKPLVMAFARRHLPGDFHEIQAIFGRRGVYQRFRALLMQRKALDRWYAFEAEETERALREWCEENSIILTD
jgi:hypothetical protein